MYKVIVFSISIDDQVTFYDPTYLQMNITDGRSLYDLQTLWNY